MPVPSRPVSPEQMAEGRRIYEQTRMPVADIAALMGISVRSFYTRLRAWGWRRRMNRIPHLDPSRTLDDVPAATPIPAPAVDPSAKAVATRIERLVERELTTIEKVIARHGLDDQNTEQVERSARVLASLARTLHEVKRLDATDTRREENNDRGPDDPDDFVRELARRMDEFARRAQSAVPDVAAASDAGASGEILAPRTGSSAPAPA